MRIGGPVFCNVSTPERWVAALRSIGAGAAFFPELPDSDGKTADAFADAARREGILIAEVGVWNNPLSPDDSERRSSIRRAQEKLALADRIGAACCVNIAGSRGANWAGPDPRNLTDATFDMIVESVRGIIDAVKPARTSYTLEPMPWMYPDDAASYLRLIDAIDRAAFAVHFDPVNMISSPRRYYGHVALVHEFVAQLGPRIKSVHAKDIVLRESLTVHLDEVLAGEGTLDYAAVLRELAVLGPDLPVLVEHMQTPEECARAMDNLRRFAREAGVPVTPSSGEIGEAHSS